MAYSSLGTQWPTEKDSDGNLLNPVLTHSIIKDIALRHHVSTADVILSWVLQEGAIAIPRSATKSHLESNIRPIISADNGRKREKPAVFLTATDIACIRRLHGSRPRS